MSLIHVSDYKLLVTSAMPDPDTELLTKISSLHRAEKFRLAHLLLKQLAKDGAANSKKTTSVTSFNSRDFFGAGTASKQEVDEYLK